jgi:ubiquinone/menaquinone biosynthesis C-methylase UbiE
MYPGPEDVARLYTQQSDVYSTFAANSFGWQFIERPTFDNLLCDRDLGALQILDAGCGSGRSLEYLLAIGVPAHHLLGVDLTPAMVNKSRQLVSGVRHVVADVSALPVAPETQDIVLCTHVLHYLDNIGYLLAMESFMRVLKPGGTLFVSTTHPVRTSRDEFDKYFDRRWKQDNTPWKTSAPFYVRPVGDLVNLAMIAGFKLTNFEEPEVVAAGKRANEDEYKRYSAFPSRLALTFTK